MLFFQLGVVLVIMMVRMVVRMLVSIRLVTDQIRFKSEAGHSIFVCIYVIYEHPQLYFKLNMQFRSAVFGFMNQL